MADNPGILVSYNGSLLGTTTPEWFENYPEYPLVIGAQPASSPLNGISTDNRPIPFPSVNFPGARVRNYSDIFYNQIILDPSALNAGNIASNVIFVIDVSNLYFVDTTITSIVANNLSGVSISGPPIPFVFRSLSSTQYVVTIKTIGPVNVNGSYTFNFSGGIASIVLPITGMRTVLFPYRYRTGATEKLEWRTIVEAANDGTEQRARLRNSPRQSFNVTCPIPLYQMPYADNLLHGWRQQVWAVPVWSESRINTQPILAGDTLINVSTEFGDFRVGELVLIYKGALTYDLLTIMSLTTSTIVVQSGTSRPYRVAEIAPIRTSFLRSSPTRDTTGTVGTVSSDFYVLDNTTLQSSKDSQPYNDGIETFEREPLLNPNYVSDRYQGRIDIVDYESGAIDLLPQWLYTKKPRTLKYILEDSQDLWNFRLWLHRRAGRDIPFYMPTFENNLVLVNKTGTITNSIIVKNSNITNFAQNRKRIAFKTVDNNWLYREIDSFTDVGDGTAIIVITQDLNLPASDVSLISYVGKQRLVSDNVSITHGGNFTSQVTFQIIETA